jgi:diguanylate cyclase (GGDEF)-like protein
MPITVFVRLRGLVTRHRLSVQDLSILAGLILVASFIAFEFDIYEHEGMETVHEETIELNEALSLGGMLAVGLLVFAVRRYQEQRRETRRRVAAEQHARELALQDALTGLPNRRQFDDALKTAIASPPRAGAVHAVFLLDLNGFKQVNDVHGHGIGDEVLIIVAQRLLSGVRQGDLVARFGGDEFAILAQHLIGAEAATNIALRVLQALEAPVVTGKSHHQVGAGIGIALIPSDADTEQEALRKADVALYRAKAERRSALRFFEADMDRHVHERAAMEREVRAAIASGDIRPFYQPTVDLKTRAVVGFEAVPRWHHPELGDVPPERFIPLAEDAGLIHDLAERLLRLSCAAAMQWPPQITLAVDIFPSQLKDRELKARITRILAETGLAPSRLEVEITESAIVQDLEAARQVLGGLREAGVKIALDNFGTGYSSLYHLRNFKLDKIKIDRSFIESMGSARESAEIVSALVGLGHGLGLTVTADGVEDPDQRASLLGTGVQQGQGDFFSELVSTEQTLAFFTDSSPARV